MTSESLERVELAASRSEVPPANPELEAWLVRFEAAVRARDFAAGRALFAPDAVAFGTRAEMARGIDEIVAEQWRHVWPQIHDFHFGSRVTRTAGDTGWVAAMWQTRRLPALDAARARVGRGTFVLERRNGQWLAVHSHFSLCPEGPQL
jgi:ketosteroid isomerase-like protein